MGSDELYGTNWSKEEVEAVVSKYMEMLALELSGQAYVKAQFNRFLQSTTGRTRPSIELKFHNISAVFQKLGLPWIWGYKPRYNFQGLLLESIEQRLDNGQLQLVPGLAEPPSDSLKVKTLNLLPPPSALEEPNTNSPQLERLIRKFDPAARDARNRLLGHGGEELVWNLERERLSRSRPNLVEKVEWTSRDFGDGAGYDIRSFDDDGNDRFIEVKTTNGYERTPFFVTANELGFAEERPREFRLVRVFDFARSPSAFELAPPLQEHILLAPYNYRASLL